MTNAQRTSLFFAPLLALAAWFAAVTVGFALAALQATEPPAWDSLSYLQKAFTFWQAVDAGKPFNPFDLPMTIRPPGTVLLSYPLGWSEDFRWFYFRSSAIPAALLIAAVLISGWRRDAHARERWLLAALAAAAAGIPILYQFQYTANDWPSTWGLVDGFMAGVAAVSAAAVVRSTRVRSAAWAAAAALAAAFCLMIKPTGALVMGLTGAAWIIIALLGGENAWARIRTDARERRFLLVSIAFAFAIFVMTAATALTSAYFSAENVAFGQHVFNLFDGDSPTGAQNDMSALLHRCFGFAVPIIILGGLLSALLLPGLQASAVAAVLCLMVGGWYWLSKTELAQVRYFLPFGMMAFVLLVPAVLEGLRQGPSGRSYAFATAATVPAFITTVLLLIPAPPQALQRIMGVNLTTNAYGPENAQAADLLRDLEVEGVKHTYLYITETSPALRNILAVASYPLVTDPRKPQVNIIQPVDWQNPSATRTEGLLRSSFVAFTPIKNEASRAAVLAHGAVPDFQSETLLINAWLTELGEADGVKTVSETRVRIIRVVDPALFEGALARLEQAHTWPESYYAANPQRWWSREKLDARDLTVRDATFHRAEDPAAALYLRGAASEILANGSLRVSFWVEGSATNSNSTLGDGWRIFAHLLDGANSTLANGEAALMPGTPPNTNEPIRLYTVTYAAPPKSAVAVAFGFLRSTQGAIELLVTDSAPSDWDGHRLILRLPASR